jgi:DTW domain-containing protein YfiP
MTTTIVKMADEKLLSLLASGYNGDYCALCGVPSKVSLCKTCAKLANV